MEVWRSIIWGAILSFLLEDLGSSNGTFHNRQKVSSHVTLSAEDQIQLGQTIIMEYIAPLLSDETHTEQRPIIKQTVLKRPSPVAKRC
ncbi:MAG: FHA domain-containing protein [Chloroflexota bacterium]|nr:MAG: FHA domain-containing protein [Chloroflexota bacterium]